MGNDINITRFEFAATKPWLLDEEATVGKEQIPIAVFSVRAGIMSYFNVFVQRGFSFQYVDEFGNTPLHYAAEKNHDYVSALLLP
jgi:ankyrin repeat protein